MTILESLYGPSTSAVLHEGEVGQSFRTSVGIHQEWLLSPVLFNLYLENIMQEPLHNFNGTISINGREISNLRLADDIDLIAGTEQLQQLTKTLERRVRAYGMEIRAEKSNIMVNSRIAPSTILMNGEHLEEIKSFKYTRLIISSEGDATGEICTQINLAASVIAKLKKIWSNSNIKTATKIRLYKSLVVSVLTYRCESWTLKAESERGIATFEMKYFRRILKISYRDHITNISVMQAIAEAAGPQEPLFATEKRRKLKWFGHTTRHNTKEILQGTVKGGRK